MIDGQFVNDLILALRAPEWTKEFEELHARIHFAALRGKLTDELLNECADAECLICAVIVCPHHEPLHFHHDGCPACAQPRGDV